MGLFRNDKSNNSKQERGTNVGDNAIQNFKCDRQFVGHTYDTQSLNPHISAFSAKSCQNSSSSISMLNNS